MAESVIINANRANNQYTHLGNAAKDGANVTTITLADSVLNYSFILVGIAYYASGLASYGQILIPTKFGRDIWRTEGAVLFASDLFNFNNVGVFRVQLPQDNQVLINPINDISAGNYYVIGIK